MYRSFYYSIYRTNKEVQPVILSSRFYFVEMKVHNNLVASANLLMKGHAVMIYVNSDHQHHNVLNDLYRTNMF